MQIVVFHIFHFSPNYDIFASYSFLLPNFVTECLFSLNDESL